jgi:hypothetical protein
MSCDVESFHLFQVSNITHAKTFMGLNGLPQEDYTVMHGKNFCSTYVNQIWAMRKKRHNAKLAKQVKKIEKKVAKAAEPSIAEKGKQLVDKVLGKEKPVKAKVSKKDGTTSKARSKSKAKSK